ncbi:TFAM [Acanthosepion pharaonis]|uniref:TFAM n=1 Tax=Acanthosepion pharaonis TaxID=158019 RepID=A0A812DUR2_ACAPH|nr:TFAM [Sepia pharaonis]
MALVHLSSSLRAVHSFTSKASLCFLRPLTNLNRNLQKTDLPKPPKRPVSSFFEFMLNNRQDIITNNPGISTKDVVRRSAEMYKNLSDGDRKVLQDRAGERMQQYKQQYKAFKNALTPEQLTAMKENRIKKREIRTKRKKKEVERKYGRPKRPMNAYAIFTRAYKVERGNMPFVEFSKKLSSMWKNMPEDEKAIYIEEARLERERYAEEIIDWEELMLERALYLFSLAVNVTCDISKLH